jgi:aspartate/methionine/tyrosine aminotransferase
MKIDGFGVENWMNAHEQDARWNLGETCVDSLSLDELLELGGDAEGALLRLRRRKLTYGDIFGACRLRQLIAGLYESISPDQVLTATGAIGANFLAEFTLVEPGDLVVCVEPTYQQLYAVPKSLGAEVRLLKLRPENGFLPDMDELRELAGGRAKLIVINNPNNPTGALMERDRLLEVAAIARECGAYVLADEVYRGLEHDRDSDVPSIADVYERGIGTGSMSKLFSLAGLRLGWIAGPRAVIEECEQRRNYTTISCGVVVEELATLALESVDRLMARNLAIVRTNAATLAAWMAGEPRLSWTPPRAGTTAFIGYDHDVPSERFALDLFRLNGTFIVPGSAFGWEGRVRVGFACSADMLGKGLEGLSEYLRTLEA